MTIELALFLITWVLPLLFELLYTIPNHFGLYDGAKRKISDWMASKVAASEKVEA